jgi:hypothetical protein
MTWRLIDAAAEGQGAREQDRPRAAGLIYRVHAHEPRVDIVAVICNHADLEPIACGAAIAFH